MSFITDIIAQVSSFAASLVVQFGYLGIFVTMTMESAALPVPSEIVLPLAGYAAQQGQMNLLLITIVATLANLTGSLITYWIGWHGGRKFIARYGHYFLMSERELVLAEEVFKKHGAKIVLAGRMLPVVRTYISLPAGAARMDLRKFIAYTTLGSLPWNFALAYLGFTLGENWTSLESTFRQFDYIIIGAGVLAIAYAFYWLHKNHKNKKKTIKNK